MKTTIRSAVCSDIEMEREAVVVKPIIPEDLPALAELERLCFADPWSAGSLEILTRDGGFGVAVWEEGRLLAYGGMTYVLDEGSVTNIATHPEYRRRGLGRKALSALLAMAEEHGLSTVFLEVRESNEAAKSLYRSMGFEPCGVRKNFYRHPTEHAVQMVRQMNKEID